MHMVLRISEILGQTDSPELENRLAAVADRGGVEYLPVGPDDVARHRLKLETDAGTECLISLPRDVHLSDGAVLLLEEDRAVVVRVESRAWLRFEVDDIAAGLKLGHLAGHLHWAVQFRGSQLWVAMDDPASNYLARLGSLLTDGQVRVVDGETT